MSDLLGKWYKETDEGYKEIDVIGLSPDRTSVETKCRKILPISSLKVAYKRKEDLNIDDPYSNTELLSEIVAGAKANGQADIVVNVPVDAEPTQIPHQATQPVVQEPVVVRTLSTEEQLIQSAIDVSKTTDSVEISIKISLPITLSAVSTIANAMSIDRKLVSDVIVDNVKQIDPDQIYKAMATAILDKMNEPISA